VAHALMVDVVFYCEVMHTMNGCASIVTSIHSVTSHIRLSDSANHMEVNRILSKEEGLTNIFELHILNLTD
jgi:uncharacterized protein YceK